MKRVRIWLSIIIPIILVIALAVVCVNLWQHKTIEENDLKVMCKSSVNAAMEHFENYQSNGNEAEYISGVAEFRAYMTTYLCLTDEPSDADYTWCNILYGYMTMKPEEVKANISDLIDALEYLAEDYDHPNGFNLINALNNKIAAE
ncbi:MAG: hypothetical protein II990_03920 [Muribaculaceae bacterium]|nr:hypothetical protein [Muribaculaceae bacterium]